MAEYQELLEAITAIRRKTGDERAWTTGLTTAELAVATNPMLTSEARIRALISKIRESHPDVFGIEAAAQSGSAADAIRAAEVALASQNSHAAQLDLQVITAILNAHSVNEEGQRSLLGIQHEIEDAVLARTDLNTPTGARDFQRYLLGKLREMRSVVDATGVDATSKASLSAALASLYASATPTNLTPETEPVQRDMPTAPQSSRLDPVLDSSCDLLDDGLLDDGLSGSGLLGGGQLDAIPPASPVPPAPTLPPPAPTLPAFGGGALPGGGAGGLGLPASSPVDSLFPGAGPRELDPISDDAPDELGIPDPDELEPEESGSEEPEHEQPESAAEPVQADDSHTAQLPDGETVAVDSAQLAAAITAATQGVPIAQAFQQQGITIAPPGSPVPDPIDVAQLRPGDVGIYQDGHALFVGSGKALYNNSIQPISALPQPGFLGWLKPDAVGQQPEPMPIRPSLTTAAPLE